MKLKIVEIKNGYVVTILDTIKNNGDYGFKSIEILPMLEFIGEAILDKKIKVKEL